MKIEKRPLLRPAIPSPYNSAKDVKVIYLKRNTPFIPTVKRVRSLLAQAEKRTMQAVSSKAPGELEPKDAQKLSLVNVNEEVYVKATGRAIFRATEIAWFFEQQEGSSGRFRVRVKTGSVSAVDDVVEGPSPVVEKDKMEGVESNLEKCSSQEEEGDIPETQLRQTGSVEIAIGLK